VIARIAYFDDFDLTGRDWVLDALADAEGFHGAYHLYDETTGGSISISFWDDVASQAAGQQRVAAASRAGGHAGPGPSRVTLLRVLRHA
jgi:heme-degrading monooxygenase HmoA